MDVRTISAGMLIFSVAAIAAFCIGFLLTIARSFQRYLDGRRPSAFAVSGMPSSRSTNRRGVTVQSRAVRDERILHIGANKIIAHDGNGAFLVRAQQADDIAGGPSYFLPYNISRVNGQRSLYIVYQGNACPDYRSTKWITAQGTYRIMPYEPTFPADILLGQDATWQYVQEIK